LRIGFVLPSSLFPLPSQPSPLSLPPSRNQTHREG
jgi:NAD(P)-dependent dehydrogenase (short-subunit alcohol dehydrogenase family)